MSALEPLTVDDLRAEGLPLDVEAFPFYPAGVEIYVGGTTAPLGVMILTDDSDLSDHVALGCYDIEQTDGIIVDVSRPLLADAITYLLSPPEGVEWQAWAEQRLTDDPTGFYR